MEAGRDQQRRMLVQRRRELSERGHLPETTPVEEYFQAIAAVAVDNRLLVVRHQPLSSRSYPGLLERRYVYEVAGGFSQLMQFLKAIEQSGFWADVSYFRIQKHRGTGKADSAERSAMLTMSLFSAAAAVEPGPGSPGLKEGA